VTAKITKSTTILELGAIVSHSLREAGLDAFLSGGAVVSIYTKNRYESYDLDFVSLDDRRKIKRCMEKLGFTQDKSRHFIHPNSSYFVEFPGSSMTVGDELIQEFNEIRTPEGVLKLLTPTDCVKDRLAAYYHFNDPQGLDQAVWVAEVHPINLESVRHWSKNERMLKKFEDFENRIKIKLPSRL
jgi:hypothetical protein